MANLSQKERLRAARTVVRVLGPTIDRIKSEYSAPILPNPIATANQYGHVFGAQLNDHTAHPSVDPCRSRLPWALDFDSKSWTLAILPYIQLWSGYAVRDTSRRCGTAVGKYADENAIDEIDILCGNLGNKPRKGKYHLSISIQPTFSAASAEWALARELTAKNCAIAILTQLSWVNRMVIGPNEVPDLYVLDGVFHGKTLAWFVWPTRSSGSFGRWMRLAKGK
jgi:hypothetical protein